jgi:predicted RNase H-like nuclease (RuvC/YqgF family)
MSGVTKEVQEKITKKLKEVESLLEDAGVAYKLELETKDEEGGHGGVGFDGYNDQDWDVSWC